MYKNPSILNMIHLDEKKARMNVCIRAFVVQLAIL